MDWLTLSLVSAFSLASADAFTKKWLGDYTARELVVIRFGFTGLLFLPILVANPLPPVPWQFWGWVAAAVPLEFIAMLLYMEAIRSSPLALTVPYLAFTPVFTALVGLALLGESISAKGWAGVLLVVAGAYLLNVEGIRSGARAGRMMAPLKAFARERGSQLTLAVAIIYGITSVMGKAALQYVPGRVFGPFYFVLLGALALIVFSLRQPGIGRVMWRRPGAHLLVSALFMAMVMTHFMAIERIEAAYMISVKRTSLLFGILYGAWLFREKGLGMHLAAGALMVAGVALIAL
ncbi:MAG: DMT family transporter [Betaproteobacteria bacterium]|nr:DMT family transporter [Betaproteobacteria bacterium]